MSSARLARLGQSASGAMGLVADSESEEFPAWAIDEFGTLTLTVRIRGSEIRLATVTGDPDTGLFKTYRGCPSTRSSSGSTTSRRRGRHPGRGLSDGEADSPALTG